MGQKKKDNRLGAYFRIHQIGDQGRCGFVTGTHYEINQYDINDMTIAQSKALFERMQEDDSFRGRILGADNLDDCMKIVELNGYDCSTDEVKMALNKYTSDKTSDSCGNFTLWGNRIPG